MEKAKRLPGDSLWRLFRRRAADAVETVFGPDPGLLRLRTAARTVISAAITLTALLLLLGSSGMKAAAPIALGFMTSIFANMTVRDSRATQQAMTMALLFAPMLASVMLSSFLSRWPWVADIGFIAVVTCSALAQWAGRRAMAMGMVAFIGYFIGVIIHPPLQQAPQLAAAIAIGLAAAAVTRFALLRDNPGAALRQVKLHIDRRVARILGEVADILASGDDEPTEERKEAQRRRFRYEIGQLNDALLIAADQIDTAAQMDEDERQRLSGRFFAVELAAFRGVRPAARDAR